MFFTEIQTPLNHKLQRLAAGIILTSALGSFGILGESVHAESVRSVAAKVPTNGTYVYGETSQPNQVYQSYLVFNHQNGKVVGAFYTPRSEFTCFTGSQKHKTLDVEPVSVSGTKTTEVSIQLSGLHRLQAVSANDQRILSACKKETA